MNVVCFSGTVFQKLCFMEQAVTLLSANDFGVCLPELIPVDDDGMNFGQIIGYIDSVMPMLY